MSPRDLDLECRMIRHTLAPSEEGKAASASKIPLRVPRPASGMATMPTRTRLIPGLTNLPASLTDPDPFGPVSHSFARPTIAMVRGRRIAERTRNSTMALDRQSLDQAALDTLVGKAVSEFAAGYGGLMMDIGRKLGLYHAMAGAGPVTSQEVARTAGCAERYVREWLNAQAAGGYVAYHRGSGTYELTPEQAFLLADETSPVFMPPIWEVIAAAWADEAKTIEAFRTGKGVSWGEHDGRLHCGVAAFYRNGYRASLVGEWAGARRRGRQARGGRASCRHRLWPRPVDAPHGRSLSKVAVPWLRHA